MMKVALLGSGSATPDPKRGNPSQAVIVNDEILLFDCGERTSVNLIRANINPLNIGYLFFTHLHWDHISDYGYFIITNWNCGRRKILEVYGPKGTKNMSDMTIYGAHKVDVEFLKMYRKRLPHNATNRPEPEVPVIVKEIGEGTIISNEKFKVSSRWVKHYNKWGMLCLGYRVDSKDGAVAISGDTSPCDAMIELAKDVDILIHECTFLDEILEQRTMKSHTGPSGVGRIAQRAGAKKLVLTHLGPYTSFEKTLEMASTGGRYVGWNGPHVWTKIVREVAKYYDGPIVLGEDAMIIDL